MSDVTMQDLRNAARKMNRTNFVLSRDMRLAVNAGLMSDDHADFLLLAAAAHEGGQEQDAHERALLEHLGLCPECGSWGVEALQLRKLEQQGECVCGTDHYGTELFNAPAGDSRLLGWGERLDQLIDAAEVMTRKAIFDEVAR